MQHASILDDEETGIDQSRIRNDPGLEVLFEFDIAGCKATRPCFINAPGRERHQRSATSDAWAPPKSSRASAMAFTGMESSSPPNAAR
jgi:hypothetical protein